MKVPTESDTTGEPASSPLLLHSLAEFRELILSCLDATGATSVAEIGSEEGSFTRELLRWAEDRDAHVYCIDPAPAPALVDLAAGSARVDLVLQRSVDALEHLPRCDAYLVDGDHNYHTVRRELEAIAGHGRDGTGCPLVFVHDVGWPAGHRDMYYSPGSIPPEERHEHAYDRGAVPWRPDLVEGGFRGEGKFAWAVHEGGPRNGVAAAVDDFLDEHPELEFVAVPCIFGLGVVYDRSAPYAPALAAILARYDDVLLARLEDNRLRLYLRVVQMQDDLADLRRELEKSALHLRDAEVENRALWGRLTELEEHVRRQHEVIVEVRRVLPSRSMAMAERLSQLSGRLRGRPGLSLDRLRALVADHTE